jgi:sugar phosphate isomerase/epimerase
MKLENDYFNSMDKRQDNYITSIGNIGIGTHAGKDQLQELKAKIMKGAGAVELGFMGRGKGVKGQGNTTPGMHGKEEREAMRQLAKVNKVRLSTHASTSAGSWSGLHEGRFDEQAREQNVFEGKRAVEFAAEVAEGGPIVIHTGEFPRSISKTPDETQFKGFPGEFGEEGAPGLRVHHLLDKKTGAVVTGVREDQENFMPVYKKVKDKSIWNPEKTIEHIEWVKDVGGQMKTEKHDWSWYEKEAKKNEKKYDNEFRDPSSDEYNVKYSDDPAVLFHYEKLESQRLHSLGQAEEYEYAYRRHSEDWQKIRKELDFWERVYPTIAEEDRWRYDDFIPLDRLQKVEPYKRTRLEYLKRELQDTEKQLNYGREIAAASRTQIAQIEDQQKRVIPIQEFVLEKSADSIARMAEYARKLQKDKDLKRDLFIAPENIFPEMGYGAHPDELKTIVQRSRKAMADHLHKQGMNEKEAVKTAEKHIKATFDIGHAYTWKKYFQKDPKNKKSEKEQFNDWLIKQVGELNKAGVLGHVHITDNFGYYDEHLSPGQGDVPVKDFVKQLKSDGYKGQITIETADQDYKALTEMWRVVNSPIYKIDGASQGWTDVESGYFGRTQSPNYLFGPTAPDPKLWTTWSELPME